MKTKPRAFTQGLGQMIQRDLHNAPTKAKADEVIAWYDEGIEHYAGVFAKVPDPLVRAHSLHQAIDHRLVESSKKDSANWNKISCRKGCAFCCHTVVNTTQDEAHLLIAFAEELKYEINWPLVEEQALVSEKSEDLYFELPQEKNRCVFLGSDNTCQVYEHRPASCRKYFVVSPPEDCSHETKVPGDLVLNYVSLESEMLTSGAFEMDHKRQGSLQAMLLKARKELIKCSED